MDVVGAAMADVKLNAPLLPSGRAQLTTHGPAFGTCVSGALTVFMSLPNCAVPRLTMLPPHTRESPIWFTSFGLARGVVKTSCNCVGATVTFSLGAGFDDDNVFSPAARATPIPRNPNGTPNATYKNANTPTNLRTG